MSHKLRITAAGLAAAGAALLSVGSAQAAVPGLGSLTSTNCTTSASDAQDFLAWGDSSEYFAAPDGSFAAGGQGWNLNGGANVVSGGDGYSLAGQAPSTQSLALPSGSSATSPNVCITLNSPTIRFFAENSGSSTSTLLVSATTVLPTGASVTLPVADITASGSWNPSPIVPIVSNLLDLFPGASNPITLTFTPQGAGGAWQIDDLYVDPWTRGNCC